MAIVPAIEVPSPAARGLRYGLFTAANGPVALTNPHGQGGGVWYRPVTCGHAHLYPIECDDTPPELVFDDRPDIIDAFPFLVYGTAQCTVVGASMAELQAEAERNLANGEQTVAEEAVAELLAGAATPVTADDPTSITAVVAELEQWLYGSGGKYGNVGVLHAPVRAAAYAARAGLLTKSGPVFVTPMGTVWSFGAGYPDDGQVYISGVTTVWQAPDVTTRPGEQVFNTRNNMARLVAEREYAVAFDCLAAKATYGPDLDVS